MKKCFWNIYCKIYSVLDDNNIIRCFRNGLWLCLLLIVFFYDLCDFVVVGIGDI